MPLDLGQQSDAIQEENTITISLIHEGEKTKGRYIHPRSNILLTIASLIRKWKVPFSFFIFKHEDIQSTNYSFVNFPAVENVS